MTNYNRLLANWNELEGALKKRWKKLTDEDLERLRGGVDSFADALGQRYGIERDKASTELEQFFSTFGSTIRDAAEHLGSSARHAWRSGKHRAQDMFDSGRQHAADAFDAGRDQALRARRSVEETVSAHPFWSVGAALGAGLIAGLLLRRRN